MKSIWMGRLNLVDFSRMEKEIDLVTVFSEFIWSVHLVSSFSGAHCDFGTFNRSIQSSDAVNFN